MVWLGIGLTGLFVSVMALLKAREAPRWGLEHAMGQLMEESSALWVSDKWIIVEETVSHSQLVAQVRLNFYHSIQIFNSPEKEDFCLVTSIFSFSQNVFKRHRS